MNISNKVKIVLSSLMFLLNTLEVHSQATAENLLEKVYEGVTKSEYLSFNSKYYYSTEFQPMEYKDSISVEIKMFNGNVCYMNTNGAETIVDSTIAVSINRADKLLFLYSPNVTQISPKEQVKAFTSLASNLKVINNVNGLKQIAMEFPDSNQQIKRANIIVNPRTFQMVMAEYLLSSEYFTNYYDISDDIENADMKNVKWIWLTGIFADYSTQKFDEKIYNWQRYVKKTNGIYSPVSKFSGYEVFVSSPKL